MADQGRWFKLWYTALQDTDLVSLGPTGFGRWCMLGAYTKTHGNHGTVTINQNDKVFLAMMDLTPENVTTELQKMPHLDVIISNGKITVTFKHWSQYQEDHTVKERQKRHRDKVRNGIKKREEKKRGDTNTKSVYFDEFWQLYPKRKEKAEAKKSFLRINPDMNKFDLMMKGLASAIDSPDWKNENGKYIPYPAKWLKREGWLDEYKVDVKGGIIT